jgi:hypothetical protein
MKPLPTPTVPGATEAERFSNAVSQIFTIPKQEIERRESEWKKTHAESKPIPKR